MDKKLRKELGDQIAVAIAFLLKHKHDGAATKLEKHIRSAAKDLAKKFLKAKKEAEDKLAAAIKKEKVAKKSVKKSAKKVAVKSAKSTPLKDKKVKRISRSVK